MANQFASPPRVSSVRDQASHYIFYTPICPFSAEFPAKGHHGRHVTICPSPMLHRQLSIANSVQIRTSHMRNPSVLFPQSFHTFAIPHQFPVNSQLSAEFHHVTIHIIMSQFTILPFPSPILRKFAIFRRVSSRRLHHAAVLACQQAIRRLVHLPPLTPSHSLQRARQAREKNKSSQLGGSSDNRRRPNRKQG